MLNVKEKTSIPKYMKIRDAIMQDIHDGKLPPGSQLPRREELIEQYNVARATLNKAISNLTESGVLRASRKLGTFVASTDARTAHAIVCDVKSFHLDLELPCSAGDTSRNIFNYILSKARAYGRIDLQVVDSETLSPDLSELCRFNRILWLMPLQHHINAIRQAKLQNCCIINRIQEGLNCISTDHRQATRQVTELFIDQLGNDCRMIYLDYDRFSKIIRDKRREGFIDACEKYQIFYRVLTDEGNNIMTLLNEQDIKPGERTVIVSGSRYLTGSLFKFVIMNNLKFGKNIFYSDFDNIDAHINFGEPMISVIQDYAGLAEAALEFLHAPLDERFLRSVPHHLIKADDCFKNI
jgi:DNA-binding transcriptional regulator YhcF (GntR family)